MASKYITLGLSGKRGSGKDALASKLIALGWEKVSFAGELKQRVRDDFNLTVEHTDGSLKEVPCGYINDEGKELTPRDIMTTCGQYYRSIDPMFWVKSAFRRVTKNEIEGIRKLVVTDVRFPNEANFLRQHGAIMIRLNRYPALNIYKTELNNISETSLDNYSFDCIIPPENNVDLADLERHAKYFDELFTPKAIEVSFAV